MQSAMYTLESKLRTAMLEEPEAEQAFASTRVISMPRRFPPLEMA